MEESREVVITNLTSNVQALVEECNKSRKMLNYAIERIKNLNAIVNSSDSDMPKELIKNWMSETLDQLIEMVNTSPETIGK